MTPAPHESDVSPGFADAAWEATGGSCAICGRVAATVILIRRVGLMEQVEPRCHRHTNRPRPTAATSSGRSSSPLKVLSMPQMKEIDTKRFPRGEEQIEPFANAEEDREFRRLWYWMQEAFPAARAPGGKEAAALVYAMVASDGVVVDSTWQPDFLTASLIGSKEGTNVRTHFVVDPLLLPKTTPEYIKFLARMRFSQWVGEPRHDRVASRFMGLSIFQEVQHLCRENGLPPDSVEAQAFAKALYRARLAGEERYRQTHDIHHRD